MNIHDISKNCLEKQILGLTGLFNVINSEEYKEIVQHLSKHKDYSKRIMITGVGKNSNIAAKISETMASLGLPSFYLNTAHVQHGDAGFIGPEDTIIHISRSGNTKEMLEMIEYVDETFTDVTQILVHCNDKKVPNFADYELFCGNIEEGDEHSLAPTTSTTVLLCILDCISVTLSHQLNFQRKDFLRFHPGGSLGKMLKAENKTR